MKPNTFNKWVKTNDPYYVWRLLMRLMQIRWVFTPRRGLGLRFREFAKYGEWCKFAASVGHQKLNGFQLQGRGLCPLTPDEGLCQWTLLGAPPPDPFLRSRSHALFTRNAYPPHIFWPGDAPDYAYVSMWQLKVNTYYPIISVSFYLKS